ncbi:MAG: hypothetical protein QM535_17970 [Limnohabitans sp.]|nr:hypothetical protein [Limnohabitans sp.]
MNFLLQKSEIRNQKSEIIISGSKSETNRLLLLKALYPEIEIENASNSDDSEVMTSILQQSKIANLQSQVFDIHHAGTAMRFLTAFFAVQEGEEVVLTGSSRMKERPIKILVEALRKLGADISYVENEGYPPLRIKGKKIIESQVTLPADVSSQYISALLLIAPKLVNGLELTLKGEITSIPYIKMTLALLNEIGVQTSFIDNIIKIHHQSSIVNQISTVESDWSSASYWYSIVALSEVGAEISLSSYKANSLQGDSSLVDIYKNFGVKTLFNENNITLCKEKNFHLPSSIVQLNLQSSPDIAQTIAVTCLGLGINCELTGLHTLKIKETDRLQALKNELEKFGAVVIIDNDSLSLDCSSSPLERLGQTPISIATYQDHRMAMAFAPLALKTSLIIEEAAVVSKSYPNFWKDLECVGFVINPV